MSAPAFIPPVYTAAEDAADMCRWLAEQAEAEVQRDVLRIAELHPVAMAGSAAQRDIANTAAASLAKTLQRHVERLEQMVESQKETTS